MKRKKYEANRFVKEDIKRKNPEEQKGKEEQKKNEGKKEKGRPLRAQRLNHARTLGGLRPRIGRSVRPKKQTVGRQAQKTRL